MPPTYRLFVDETMIATNGVQERAWFALVGCFMTLEQHGKNLHAPFESIKEHFFRYHSKSGPVVFHRIEMCCPSPRGAFSVLRDENRRNAFYDAVLDAIARCNFKLILELEEIHEYREKQRTDWRALGYMRCLIPLLTTYCDYLIQEGLSGDVMLSHLGLKENLLLKTKYWETREAGSVHKFASFFRRALSSKVPKIETKDKNIAGLQLADLVAAPIIRKLLAPRAGAGDNVEKFAKAVADIAEQKRVRPEDIPWGRSLRG